MKKVRQIPCYFFMLIFLVSCNGQNPRAKPIPTINLIESALNRNAPVSEMELLPINNAPNSITRSIIQDKSGNIWLATFGGIFKYDGHSFTNITKEESSSRFFSVLADRKGNLWFGSIGSGVYQYDGQSFQNFTTKEGLVNNEIVSIYEDKIGDIWFGANGGMSRYDGKNFRNYMMNGDSIIAVKAGKYHPNLQRPPNEVNTIIEDKTGKFWFATRGKTFIYDGTTFTTVTQNGQPFSNVRCIIEDRIGNIWLGGNGGLWRYDGIIFTHIAKNFVGYIFEDKKGNIWTSSESIPGWSLSRYDRTTLPYEQATATEIKTGEGMFFGILEDSDGHIWSGTLEGVYRYDGNTFTKFKDIDRQK